MYTPSMESIAFQSAEKSYYFQEFAPSVVVHECATSKRLTVMNQYYAISGEGACKKWNLKDEIKQFWVLS